MPELDPQLLVALVALMGLALAFIIWPLCVGQRFAVSGMDNRSGNLDAFRIRLAELQAELTAGVLDESAFIQLKRELEASLLDDVNEGPREKRLAGRSSLRWVTLFCVLALPLAAMTLYLRWGAYEEVARAQQLAELQASGLDSSPGGVARLLGQLRDRLEQSPENLEGWAMLGRSYMKMQNYLDAAWAYRRLAIEADKQDADAATAWGLSAQASFFENEGRLSPAVEESIAEALKHNADEVNALGLLGIMAFEQGDYAEAVRRWQRIVDVAPDHPQLDAIQAGIARAREALGEPVATMPAPMPAPMVDQAAVGSVVSLDVRVDIDPALKQGLDPNTTVFVFARAISGPPMPLAISRHRVSELPLRVRLDDSLAMSPQARLSSVEEVAVVARVSFSGQAMPNSGDLQGELSPLKLADVHEAITIRIDQRLP